MTRLERWIYRDLIEVYYDSEKPLPLDVGMICHVIGAREDDEREAVEWLLKYKFQKTDEGFRHKRCDAEIADYHKRAEIARQNGKGGGRPKKAKGSEASQTENPVGSYWDAGGLEVETRSKTNQEPVTSNQKPDKNTYPDDFEQVWGLYPRRPGASKADALKAWNARIKAGATPKQMIDGVIRYAAYVQAEQVAPQYIKQPVTFFGSGEHYLSDWTPMEDKKTEKFDPTAYVNQGAGHGAAYAADNRNIIDVEVQLLEHP